MNQKLLFYFFMCLLGFANAQSTGGSSSKTSNGESVMTDQQEKALENEALQLVGDYQDAFREMMDNRTSDVEREKLEERILSMFQKGATLETMNTDKTTKRWNVVAYFYDMKQKANYVDVNFLKPEMIGHPRKGKGANEYYINVKNNQFYTNTKTGYKDFTEKVALVRMVDLEKPDGTFEKRLKIVGIYAKSIKVLLRSWGISV